MMGGDNRNLIMAIALSLAVLLAWQFFIEGPRRDAQQAREEARQELAEGQTAPGHIQPPSAEGVGPGPAPAIGAGLDAVQEREQVLGAVPRVEIRSPRVTGSISLRGAKVDDLTLLDYRETVEQDSAHIVLLKPIGSARPYYAEFGWWTSGTEAPGPDAVWQANRSTLTPTEPVTLTWTNSDGVTFEQEIALDNNYMFSVTQRVRNGSGGQVTVAPYGVVSRTGTPDTIGFYILHEGLIGVLGDTLKEIGYSSILDDARREETTTGGWLGITDKYWLVALVPDQDQQVRASFSGVQPAGGTERYQTDFLTDTEQVPPGGVATAQSRLFAGAKETMLLDRYRDEGGIVKFDLAVDFGWFYFLTKPIFYAIHWFNEVLGNFGLAILALTVCIKLVFFPLANYSYKSMSRMKLLQPKMMEIKERYGDDRQKMNQEMMALYKNEKVNPLSGCLPILVQIPVFFALYKVLFVTIEMRHAPFYGWIEDLSAQDPLGVLTLFGLIDWQVPGILAILNIGLWPIIMGLTMWLQQKLNPAPPDPIQQKIFTLMPIFFTFLLASFPAGLVIYWAWNNSLSILQQYVIMRRMGVAIGGGKAESTT